MTPETERAPDPFFAVIHDGEWNACIGRQGDHENYVDGYMEAALEIVAAVIDKRQWAKRDTLAMPILYNARHAVELTLKFAIDRLFAGGILTERAKRNHDIQAHWEVLKDAATGDSDLRKSIAALKPYVESLGAIDEDGQQLRYAETQEGEKSLADKSLVNLRHIRKGLIELSEILKALKYRAMGLEEEGRIGTSTPELSRKDLYRVASMLPQRSFWDSEVFVTSKEAVMREFELGSRRFSAALDVIQKHRELGGVIGIEFDLAYLTDEHAHLVVTEWSKVHTPRCGEEANEFDYWDRDWDKFREGQIVRRAAEETVAVALTPEEIADLETIFYLGRDGRFGFCEQYEDRLATRLKLTDHNKALHAVSDIMSKTNLLMELIRGLRKLGRNRLADELQSLRPDVFQS